MRFISKLALIGLIFLSVCSTQAAVTATAVTEGMIGDAQRSSGAQEKYTEIFAQACPGSVWNIDLNIPKQINGNNECCLRPLIGSDERVRSFLLRLFSDPRSMASFGSGSTFDESRVDGIIERADRRWSESDLTSYFVVFRKEAPVGICAINGNGSKPLVPGVAEVFYIIDSELHGQGIGGNTVDMLKQFMVFLYQSKVLIGGEPISFVRATANIDNIPSQSMLKRLGLKPGSEIANPELWRRVFGLCDAEAIIHPMIETRAPFNNLLVLNDTIYSTPKALFLCALSGNE